jgi:hypothetical protein
VTVTFSVIAFRGTRAMIWPHVTDSMVSGTAPIVAWVPGKSRFSPVMVMVSPGMTASFTALMVTWFPPPDT